MRPQSDGVATPGNLRATPIAVTVEDVRKAFRETPALHGIDLSIEGGELLALLGPSGSGKTTLLRVIAGLEIPDGGRVLFGGADVTAHPVQERGIGFVFQSYALFRHLTVFDNIAYGPRSRGRLRPSAADLRRRVLDLLDLVQLPGLGDRFPAELSGGQRQRVALARALATDPKVLLLDEPFGALDAQVRRDLRRWLKAIHRETGQTTIFVTHDQDEALELADRVAILALGKIEQVGTPDEIYDRPATPFVMGFVGESVALPVRIEAGRVRLGSHVLPQDAGGVADGPADLFLRPADLVLAETAEALPAMVTGTRRVGAVRRVEVRLCDGDVLVEVDAPSTLPAPGQSVGVALRGGRIFPRP